MCFRFLQAVWRYLKSGVIAHHHHGAALEYEGLPELGAPVEEPAR
jgi:hypothetical protein